VCNQISNILKYSYVILHLKHTEGYTHPFHNALLPSILSKQILKHRPKWQHRHANDIFTHFLKTYILQLKDHTVTVPLMCWKSWYLLIPNHEWVTKSRTESLIYKMVSHYHDTMEFILHRYYKLKPGLYTESDIHTLSLLLYGVFKYYRALNFIKWNLQGECLQDLTFSQSCFWRSISSWIFEVLI